MKVTIEISSNDFEDMITHFARHRIGRPMVAVSRILEVDGEPVIGDLGIEALATSIERERERAELRGGRWWNAETSAALKRAGDDLLSWRKS